MKPFKVLYNLLQPFKIQVALNILFNAFYAIFNLFSLYAIIPILKTIFVEESNLEQFTKAPELKLESEAILQWANYTITEQIRIYGKEQALVYFCAFIVSMFILKNVSHYFSKFFLAPIKVGVVKNLRQSIYKKIINLHLGFFSNERKGNILSKITNDVIEVEVSSASFVEIIFREPLSFIVLFSTLLLMSWKLTLFVFVMLPISGLLISLVSNKLKKRSRKGQAKLGELISIIEETLGGLRIIKAFNSERYKSTQFQRENQEYFRLMVRLYRLEYLAQPFTEILGVFALITILWYGGQLVLQDSLMRGEDFIFYLVAFSQMIPPAKSIIESYFRIQKGMASYERIQEILDAENTIVSKNGSTQLSGFQNSIEYKNVSFAYETDLVLNNINLSITKGETVALVGASGGGKSTLVDLLPRFYDTQSGEILIDGTDIKQAELQSVRALFGIVSQESILFNDSVTNNIALGDIRPDINRVKEAARIANATEFIEQLEFGYDTLIGDRGSKLSGGQRQRLSIARAVYKNPPILILDEATSALDNESEKLVQDALNKLMKSRTSIVIAHRLSTVQNADKIYVIDQGAIAEQGTHFELLEQNGTYKKLYDLSELK